MAGNIIPCHCILKKSFIVMNLCGRDNGGKWRFAGTNLLYLS
jgi:hypothetical protein